MAQCPSLECLGNICVVEDLGNIPALLPDYRDTGKYRKSDMAKAANMQLMLSDNFKESAEKAMMELEILGDLYYC